MANIFGAKALLTLIPLNLEFEMEPSSRSSATQSVAIVSTQEEGSRVVKIQGHISRPVVGEGRGLPDRQMFFVNSRPCNLPQVKKVFNEVYKSYNVSQSPFVFANIKLDTNAYDVNVSPDKRTIMLHDQASLLESLRNALAELFEGHDQSVPKAQLLTARSSPISTPRPPTVRHQSSSIFDIPEPSKPASFVNPQKLSSTNVEKVGSAVPSDVTLPGFVKSSLIDRATGQDSVDRATSSIRRKRSLSPEGETITGPRVIGSNPSKGNSLSESNALNEESQQRAESPLFEPEGDISSPVVAVSVRPRAVEDFNARFHSQRGRVPGSKPSPQSAEPEEDVENTEERIPAVIQTPQRLSQSTIQNAFDRMRPLRTPLQQATITIGNTTTVSTVGSRSESRASKRARVHTPKFSLDGTPLVQKSNQSSFSQELRNFAAPGTQMEESDEDDNEEDRDADVRMASDRSPSPRKRLPSREFDVPRTDDIDMSSSVPLREASPESASGDDGGRAASQIDTEDSDDEFVDESEKKAREDAKVAKMIAEAEEAAARPTEENLKRAGKLFKISQKKYSTTSLERIINVDVPSIATDIHSLIDGLSETENSRATNNLPTNTQLSSEDPEERLSLTVTKSDFNLMRIIGQFNLGFILAVRPRTSTSPAADLFIIDQHASDEKYNFERFSANTVLVSQRLVHPHPLELTAVEQELIISNKPSLIANGFVIETTSSTPQDDETETSHRFSLTSLPMSKEVTFTPHDLSELLALIMENPPSSSLSTSQHIPRPSKIRKLLASRACRGSVMIGKTLKTGKMEEIVRHMGSMDKPWSCPHGRPTMRHLYGLDNWEGWKEGDGVGGLGEVSMQVDWSRYLERRKEEGADG